MAEFPFRSMEASHNKTDVTIQFLVRGLVIHIAGMFHLSSSVQKLFNNFMFVHLLKLFFLILGSNMNLKCLANLGFLQRHFLEKICVD
jgi:hypothetical protein